MNQKLIRNSERIVLTFILAMYFATCDKVNAQTVDLRITNYVATSATSIAYDIEIKASTTGITLSNNSIEIATNSSKTSGVNSATYLGNYTGYSNTSTPGYSSGITTVTTTAPGSPTTISTSFEPYMHVENSSTGTASDNTDVTFGTITGISVGSTTGILNQPMPITLVSFSVNFKNNIPEISWATACEINNDRFEILRSVDGINFQTIGSIKGNANSHTIQNYQFTDNTELNTPTYYQLKQVDFDGTTTLSKVITLQKSMVTTLTPYPNPTRNYFVVNSPEVKTVYICNILGQVLIQQNISQNQNIDITNFPTGIYLIKTDDASIKSWIQKLE